MAEKIRNNNTTFEFNAAQDTVIEASAGTGKTYTITNIIVPWLLKNTAYSLGDILIVTYTEKATGELRDRIRKVLAQTSEQLKDSTAKEDKLFKQKLDLELEKIDDAPIFTINSFCQKTLTENAIYANCSQNMTLIDEDAGLETFIGKYMSDKLAKDADGGFMHLYANKPSDFQVAMKAAVKQYYLNGREENQDIISLVNLSPEEEAEYKKFLQTQSVDPFRLADFKHYFVTQHLKEVYIAWQQEKADKNLQTYGDMIKIVHDALIENPKSKLLQVLQDKYKYAIIDEFQDTNQLQWNIFKKIFTADDTHHITIVGDPKQSIFSFQGADSKVYDVAKYYLKKHRNAHIWPLNQNYRSSKDMIKAINILSKNLIDNYEDSQFADQGNKSISPAKLNGRNLPPVHFIIPSAELHTTTITEEDTIISKIIEYCTKNSEGENKLQIWDKDIGKYRNVTFGDFTVLVRERKHANKLIEKMTEREIPFMWHKDDSLFTKKEAADWIALLSAIQSTNVYSSDILRRAFQTEFFDIAIDDVNNEKYNDLLSKERQMLLKWHNLAETRHYAVLINSIFEDSKIYERMASYDQIQSLSKYNQIGNFILENLLSKRASIANVIKILKQKQANNKEGEEKNCVEKATDSPAVKLSTIHSAKGLEFPITFYFIEKETKHRTYVLREHETDRDGEVKTLLKIITPRNMDNPMEAAALKYVAFTRASSVMFLIPNNDSINPDALCKRWPDLFIIEPLNKTDKTPEKQNYSDNDDDEKMPDTIPLAAKRLYKHSYTSLSHPKTDTDTSFNILTTEDSQRINKEETDDRAAPLSTKRYDADCGVKISDGIYDPVALADIYSDSYGKKYGTLIHEIFERIDFKFFETSNETTRKDYLSPIIDDCCKKHSLDCMPEAIIGFLTNTMAAKLPEITGNHVTGNNFKLSSISQQDKKSEIEFDLNLDTELLLNYCNGFIDLLFVREINGKKVYSILDWKTDLFQKDEQYANYDYLKSHTDDRYAIQRVLYSYCLIQWLKQFYPGHTESDIFNSHFGGIYYVYVRGCNAGTGNGIYAHTWKDYATLDKAFKGILAIIKGKYNG